MSTRRVPKRKRALFYNESDHIIHGHQSGINAIRIAKPFTHPLDVVEGPEGVTQGHRTNRSRFNTIRRPQFSAVKEQTMQEISARQAGECYLNRVSTWADPWVSPCYVFTTSSCQ